MTAQQTAGRRRPGRFRIGLIGAGRMGRTHLTAIGESSLVAVGAIAEPDPTARAEIAAAGLPVFASVAEMLAGADLDGALIAVPTDRHVEVLAEVMAAGRARAVREAVRADRGRGDQVRGHRRRGRAAAAGGVLAPVRARAWQSCGSRCSAATSATSSR